MSEDLEKAEKGLMLSKFMRFPHFEDFLDTRSLALVNPDEWPDKNDSRGIHVFKEKTRTKHLLATCLTYASETSHHWTTYGKEHGVRVVFLKERLLEAIPPEENFRWDKIRYLALKDFDENITDLWADKIPFYKRKAYQDEKEFRIIWSADNLRGKVKYVQATDDPNRKITIKYLRVHEEAVSKIIFDAAVTDEMLKELKGRVHRALGKDVSVSRTTIQYSKGWISRISKLPDPTA